MQLTTTDNDGCPSTEPGIVSVFTGSPQSIHVQLVWDTSADPDQTDSSGADLNLHFLHPDGCWEDPDWDTHVGSPSPSWGDPARTDDDPSLDIDDNNGSGPENVNLDNPENGTTYHVGLHYENDWGYGPSMATVRVYLNGTLVYEASQELVNGQFWDAAALLWPSGEMTRVDTVYDDIDEAPCD